MFGDFVPSAVALTSPLSVQHWHSYLLGPSCLSCQACPVPTAHPFPWAVSLSCPAAPALQGHHCSSSVPSLAQGSVCSPTAPPALSTSPVLSPCSQPLPFPELSAAGAEWCQWWGSLLVLLIPSPCPCPASPHPPPPPGSIQGSSFSSHIPTHALGVLRFWSDSPARSSHWHLLAP